MRKFILQNKIAIITVALVMCVSFGFTVIASSNGDTILDRIVMTYLNLKTSEVRDIEEMKVGMNSMLIEDNFPYFRINDGMYTEKDITTAGTITGEQITSTDDMTVSGTLTSAIVNSNGGSSTGVYASTTMETTATLLASSITDYSYLALTPNDANTALTLPATSTLSSFIPTAGACKTIIIENVSSVSATTTTIVAGTGMDLQEPDGQNVVIGGNNYANITFCRRSDTDMVVMVDEFIPAD